MQKIKEGFGKKMKLKKTAAVAVAALLAIGLTACGGGDGDSGGASGGEVKVNFTIDGDKATVRWEKCDGASGYSIEKAPSRYGHYEYLDYVGGDSAAEYVTDDVDSYYRITAFKTNGESEIIGTYSFETELFGNNTFVYAPTDDAEKIQEDLDSFYNKTDGKKEGADGRARGEFSEERFAALFKAGEYGLDVDMGYYTSLSGLGTSPDDVTISKISADAEISLCNFWRTAENLAVDGNMLWSVSQATSLRRVHVKGDLSLSGSGSTSGGFLADTKADGNVNSGSQQQWFSRNSSFGGWTGGVWNMAFVGVNGEGLPQNSWTGVEGVGCNLTNANITLSNLVWEVSAKENLVAPSFSITDNVIAINDGNPAGSVGSYTLNLYNDSGVSVGGVMVTNGTKIDTSKIKPNGTYTGKLVANAANAHYVTAPEATSQNASVVVNNEHVTYDMDSSGEAGALKETGVWTYWTENWVSFKGTVTDDVANLTFSNNSGNWYDTQLFYKIPGKNAGATYKVTLHINNVPKAGRITVNDVVKNLTAGDNAIELNITETSGATVKLVFGVVNESNKQDIQAATNLEVYLETN